MIYLLKMVIIHDFLYVYERVTISQPPGVAPPTIHRSSS